MSSTPRTPNGLPEPTAELTTLPPVIGINLGNSYASIAVFTKEGLAECIANEDGERQIACAISFHGEEMYIGNQAKVQLVKNSQNTITGFRNILGKKFSEIPQSTLNLSAPVIQHPDLPDVPAYKVSVLQPAPSPLPIRPGSTLANSASNYNTPSASKIPTPQSEPVPVDRYLTADEVTTIFIRSLLTSAEAFLGKRVKDAVITVPSWFTDAQRAALEKAAVETGVNVLQLLDEAGAAATTTTAESWESPLSPDRTQLLVDVGASSTSITVLAIRSGLTHVLASSNTSSVGGDAIDDKLIKHFSSEFTKKTKIPLTVVPATDVQDKRAEAKLRLALEHTKRTISASPGAATCSIESLKDGIDYTGSINRMRFDLVTRSVYVSIGNAITSLLESNSIDSHDVDEIVYLGGSTSLPGLDEYIVTSCGFHEDVETPFTRGTVVGGGIGDPTTILARGCAVQAHLISSIIDEELKSVFTGGNSKSNDVKVTSRTLGVLLPNSNSGEGNEMSGLWVSGIQKETALPARRTVRFDVELSESNKVAMEVWEVKEGIRIEKIKPPKSDHTDEEEDEEDEEIEVKHKTITKESLLGVIQFEAKAGIKVKGKSEYAGRTLTTVDVKLVVGTDMRVKVSVEEVGQGGGVSAKLEVPGFA